MNLLKLLDRPITFHRCFVDIPGSINAALMLSNAVYWTNKLPEERDGWFHKSLEEWTAETGMTRREQDTARERLIELLLIETRRAKIDPALAVSGTWFRVNVDALTAALSDPTKWRKAPITKWRKTPDQKAESANCSPFRSKNNNYTKSTTTTVRDVRDFVMTSDWLPEAETLTLLAAESIPFEFAAECLPEFRLFWIATQQARSAAAFNAVFLRQVRNEFAYQQQQEQRRHERSEARSRVSGLPQNQSGRQRKETVTERNARYERFAAGLDTGNDAGIAPENAITADFTRH
jgi:hypothetical protein